jgi:hypothetical protein
MTRADTASQPRRKRGRPPKDFTNDPDLRIAALALALQAVADLSERKAVDLALAVVEGEPVPASKMPRGASKRAAGVLIGYRLPKTVAGRNATIRRKLKLVTKDTAVAMARDLLLALAIAKRLLPPI